MMRRLSPRSRVAFGAVLLLLLAACTVQPQPILLGSQECEHCRMVISEREFAAQALNRQGRAYSFDAVECLASWLLARDAAESPEALHSLWVTDFSDPEGWIPAEEATYLLSETLRSPMGMNLSAHADAGVARTHLESFGGEIVDWEELLRRVGAEEARVGHGHGH